MERDEFLGRVRSSLRGATLPTAVGPATAPAITFDHLVERFVASAGKVGAEVVHVPNGEVAAHELVRLAGASHRPEGYIAWDALDAVAPGFYDEMATAGWQRIDPVVGSDSRLADHERVGRAKVGITGADAAIAATGSVVLAHGPGRPRSASLLAEHHIVALRVPQIVASLHEALDKVDWAPTSNVVAITGPSRTGDIESILTLGVHGPRYLSIVLIG